MGRAGDNLGFVLGHFCVEVWAFVMGKTYKTKGNSTKKPDLGI